jgi:hypothetical protein
MAGERTFLVRLLFDGSKGSAGLKLLSGDLKGFGKEITKTVPGFAALAIGATAAFGAVAVGLTKAVQAAMEDQKSQAELQRQLEKTFGANDALNASAERYISITQLRTGTSDNELRTSLGTLVRATGDYQQSLGLLNTAQDISAATGRDLGSVTIALAKASQGQFTALSKLGIPIDAATKKSKDFNKVLGDLNTQFGGASATAASTFGGQIKILKGQFGEIMEAIGKALLPYLQKLSEWMVKNVAPAIQRVTTVIGEKGLIGGLKQLVFESGGAGKGIIRFVESVAVGFAHLINISSDVYYSAKAAILALNPLKWGEAAKALGEVGKDRVNIDALKASFESLITAGNQYTLSIRDAINQQTNFKGSVTDVTDTLGGGGKSVSKTLKTATDKLKEYSDTLKSTTSAQKSFADAQKGTASATKSKADADAAVAKAQARLDQVSQGFGAGSPEALAAQTELAKAQRAQERATFAVEEAIYSVADAEMNLAKVRSDPESSPMDVRRAELALAEAKLSVSDATDSQIASTSELNDKQTLLNETVYGATIGSLVYDEALQAVNDAKDRQLQAASDLADAIDKEREAQDKLNQTIQATIDLMAKYPKVLGGMPNPMGGLSGQVDATAGGIGFNTRSGDTYAININAAIADAGIPDLVVKALQTYNKTVGKIPVSVK